MRIAGRTNLFRLSKLGAEFSNARFMSKDGENLELNEDKQTWTELTFEPWLWKRAQAHKDWLGDTTKKVKQVEADGV